MKAQTSIPVELIPAFLLLAEVLNISRYLSKEKVTIAAIKELNFCGFN